MANKKPANKKPAKQKPKRFDVCEIRVGIPSINAPGVMVAVVDSVPDYPKGEYGLTITSPDVSRGKTVKARLDRLTVIKEN